MAPHFSSPHQALHQTWAHGRRSRSAFWRRLGGTTLGLLGFFGSFQVQAAEAGTLAALASPPPAEIAIDLCQGDAASLPPQAVITHETICATGLTPPSLWWTREQISGQLRTSNKLVSSWSAQLKTAQSPGRVRLLVNPQLWSVMDYFERYDFINTFGLTAREFGYQTEVYNNRGAQLASYECAFDPQGLNGKNCAIRLGSSLNLGFRGNNTNRLF